MLLWQHFSAVFVCDCGDFVEIKFLMLLFHFMPTPKGLTLRSVLPASPGQSDGQAWLATVALLHLVFPFLCPSFTLCVPPPSFSSSLCLSLSFLPSTLLFLHCALSWLTGPANAMTTGRLLTWPFECLQSASFCLEGSMLIHVAIASVHTEQLLSSLTVASTKMIISSNKLIFFPWPQLNGSLLNGNYVAKQL